MNSMKAFNAVVYSGLAGSMAVIVTYTMHAPWFILPLGLLPLTVTGGFIVANHRRYSEVSASFVFGLLVLLLGLAGMSAFTIDHVPKPASDVAYVLTVVLGACFALLVFGVSFLRAYSRTTFAWRLRGERGIDKLVLILENDSFLVTCYHAAHILGDIGNRRVVEPLINALENRDNWVRAEAAEALGKIGDEQALPALQRLAEKDAGVDLRGRPIKEIASEAIERIKRG